MKKRLLSALLALAMLGSAVPVPAFADDLAGDGTELVQAADTSLLAADDAAIQLVADGTAANISGGQADTLYFGTYQQSSDGSSGYSTDPIQWRVLENADGKLFLLSDQNLDVFQFNIANVTVTWATSTIRSWLNGYDASHNIGTGYAGVDYTNDNFISTAFSEGEQAAIAETNVVTADNGSVDGGEDTTDKIFLLSIEQAQTSSFFSDNSSRIATNTAYVAGGGTLDGYMNGVGEANSWWLRSPGIYAENVAYVAEGGSVYSNGGSVDNYDVAVRPAFHLDLNSVLFTSAAAGGKPEGGLQEVSEYSGNQWKLTLLDASRSFSVTETTANGESGGTVTLHYAGATTGTNEYISVLLTDDQGNALYYGRVAQPTGTDGEVSVAIPAALAAGTYTLNVFSEQYNGDYQTDYASAFDAVTLTVTDTTAPTLSDGSATRDSETAATVRFTSSEAGTYYYEVVDSGAAAPSIGTDGEGTACASGENTISLDSLAGTGAKDIYIVAKDAADNVSQPLKIEIPAAVYGISASPASLDFGSETEGYTDAPAAQTVTITNTGNQTVTVNLPTGTNYAITAGEGFADNTATIAPNGTAAFTVQPKTGLGAGGYSETLTISGSNDVSASVGLSFTVLKSLAGAKVQVSGTYTYNGSEQQPGRENVTVTLGGETLTEGTDYTLSYSDNTNAGTATVTVTGKGSYSGTATGTFTINKADPTVTDVKVSSPETIYDITELGSITLTYTGTVGTLALDADQTLTVGTKAYAWTFTPDDTANYNTTTGSISLTVVQDTLAKIEVTKAPSKTSYTYGESLDTSGMVVTATWTSGATKDVTGEVTVTPDKLDISVKELTITYGGQSATQAITVTPATLTVTADAKAKTYGDDDPELTYTVSGLMGDDKQAGVLTGELARAVGEDVGEYAITEGSLSAGANYTIAFTGAKLTVNPLAVKLTWNYTEPFTYDGSGKTVTATVTNVVNSDTVALTYTDNTATDAGDYTATVTGLGNTNYTLTGATGTSLEWSIAKAKPTVTDVAVSSPATIYNSTEISAIALTHADGDTPGTVALAAGQILTVGEKDYTWTFTPTDTANYTTTTGSISLTVVQDTLARIEVTTPPTKTAYTYGESLDLSGMVVTATYESGATKVVTDEVDITPDKLDTSVKELTITYGSLTTTQPITVNPATIGIASATVQGKTYDGGQDATVTGVTFTGLVNGESLTSGTDYTVTAEFTDKSAGNSKPVAVTVTLTNGNYTFANSQSRDTTYATASIKPLQVELEWDYTEPFTYDGTEHSVTASISNTVNGDTINLIYTDNTATDAGTYTATVTGLDGTDANNYTIQGVENLSLSWSIVEASLADATVTLSAETLIYNGQPQQPTVTVTLGSTTLTGNTDYIVTFGGDTTNVGTVTVTVTGTGNYTGTATSTYAITPAVLTINGAKLAAKTYDGTTDATVTDVTFDGLQNGEALTLGTDYTATAVFADAGAGADKTATLTVTLKNGNYTFAGGSETTYTLTGQTIAKAAAAVAKDPAGVADLVYNGQAQALVTKGTATGGTMVYSLEQNGEYAESIPTGTAAGDYTVWYKVAGDANHNDTAPASVQAALAKKAATVTVQLTPANRITAGDALPTVGLAYTGLVEGESIAPASITVDGMPANTDTAGEYKLTVSAETQEAIQNLEAAKNYTLTFEETTLTILDNTVEELPAEDAEHYRLEKSDLTTVPAELEQKYSSVDDIQDAMYEVAVKALPGVTAENTELHDVTLFYSEDGGQTWTKADEDNFPKDGITVTLPYPDGTNAADYDFAVTHMATVAMNGLDVGDVETPVVTKTSAGLQFTVKSLSPIAVSWKLTPKQEGWNTGSQKPSETPDDTVYYTCPVCGYHNWTATEAGYRCDHCGNLVTDKQLAGYPNVNGVYEPKAATAASSVTAVPQTGDESNLTLWLVLLAASSLILVGATLYRRKHS